jgi:hypothetical protein
MIPSVDFGEGAFHTGIGFDQRCELLQAAA